MKKSLLAALVVLCASLTPVAHAQWAVFDAPNFSQSILTVAHTLQTVENQAVQLQNEATMLENEARNLKGLNLNTLPQIINLLSTTDRLIQQSQGLAFNVSQMNTTFARYYPQSYATGTSLTQLTADSQTRWTYSRGAVQTSMQLQAQATQNQATDEATLSSLVNQSQSAVGALQASQATNQLLALIARELMQEQQLRLTQDRAAALAQARPIGAQTSSLTIRQQFAGGGIQYTPQTVSFYNSN
jgi:P-type conjugative transfer protein TrbJ